MELQLNQPNPNNITAFVLGNGKSRLEINHHALKPHGVVFACNAIYREFEPDYLVAVDVKMVNEIIAAGYHTKHPVWTNPNKGVTTKKGLNFFNPHRGWSSGPTALMLAIEKGHKHIFIMGFDYEGNNGKFNNVYADTYNYKKSTDTATYHGNWLTQTEKIIKDWNNVSFHRVIPENGYIPDKLRILKNLKHITVKDFHNMYQGTIYNIETNQKSTI